MIETTFINFINTIYGTFTLFILIIHYSSCQSSSSFNDQHCLSIKSTQQQYNHDKCSSSSSSSTSSTIPTDYDILMAIKKSLNDWNRNQKFPSNHLSRSKRDQISSIQGDGDVDDNSHHQSQTPQQQVCYEHFGCFRHKSPFDYLNTLPASPESIGTTFSLHTRRNPIEGEKLDYDDNEPDTTTTGKSMQIHSSFNSSNNVKIIIHGFGSSSKRPWVQKMTEVLLQLDDFNIINVDWQNGSKLPNYVQAVANTQLVGKQIARLIRKIERVYNVSPARFHLIGFSLGAHVAGFAGQEIVNISRITGLDPASPLFEGYPPDVRLDPSDAQFVDVIHSNGDGFIRGGLGVYEPMGTVDFYPNGGRVQVGCGTALGALTNILYHGQWNLLCNHRRAFRFFIDSVHQDCTFRAFSCTSYEDYVRGQCFTCGPDGRRCSNMGYFANLSQGRGPMYLITRDKEPFCVNQFKVQIQFSPEQGVTWGQIELQLINVDGMNETFTLTQEVDQLKESERIQGLIVAHPKLTNVSEVTVTYTKYRGWIYYGLNEWHIDRIELLDSNFVIKTYCRQRIQLLNTVSVRLKLFSSNCTLNINHGDNHQQQGHFQNTNSNDIIISDSQKSIPVRTDQTWPTKMTNDHSSYMMRPSPTTTTTKGSESKMPIHVSYDYDIATENGQLFNGEQNIKQSEQSSRHYFARNNNIESIGSDGKNLDNGSSSLITPIINGASRMFWKLWTNINPPSTNISHSTHQIPGVFGTRTNPSSPPMTINQPFVDRILVLSPINEYRHKLKNVNIINDQSIDNDNIDNDDDDDDNDENSMDQDLNDKDKSLKSSYVLYSIIPISSNNNNNNEKRKLSPIHQQSSSSTTTSTTTIMLQPIHLINRYHVITNNEFNNNNNNIMISTTMMTPTVSSPKTTRNILSSE